jgi:YVTN family beta-propeller protein
MPGGVEMEFRVLGPVEVSDGSAPLRLGGPKQRALLADLIVNAGAVVATARLIDDLWGEDPPPTAEHTVEAYISRLRRIFTDASAPSVLLTKPPGYVLDVEPRQVDARRFEELVREGAAAADSGDDREALRLLESAIELWRGEPFADVADAPFAQVPARALADLRLLALERRIDVRLRLSPAQEVIGELEALVAAHPYREAFHAQLMLALYRSGRQTEALAAFRRARARLVEELGIEPGPELRKLEHAILRQDPQLERRAASPNPEIEHHLPRPQASPRRRVGAQSRKRGILTLGAVAIAATAVAVAVGLHGSSTSASIPANGMGVISPSGTFVSGALALPSAPASMAVGSGSVWATSTDGQAVFRINPATRAITQTISVGAGTEGIALGGGNAWVANSSAGTVSRIDTSTGRVVQTIGVGSEPTGVAFGSGAVWVTDPVGSEVLRIDPSAGRLAGAIELPAAPFGIAVGAGSVWVTDPGEDAVTRIDPAAGQPVQQVSVGADPGAIVFGFGSIWVANSLDSTVSRIDPRTGAVTATIPVGDGPAALSVGKTGIWVATRAGDTVDRIDPGNDRTTSRLRLRDRPVAVAVVGTTPWIGTQVGDTGAHRGGTLRLLSSSPFGTIDPVLGWGPVPPVFYEATYDTLVTFQRVSGSGGFQLVPDLALAVPTPEADGTEYTFLLRPGLRYSNGAPVRPEDFRHALERLFELNPGEASFFSRLVGANSCTSASRCSLSRAVTVDDGARAVTFHLTAPDADFLYKLAFPFASPAPAGVPARDVGTKPAPGTGPYMIARFIPGHEVEFVRNPLFREWSGAAQPTGFPDRIVWTFGLPVSREVSAIEAGRADWMSDSPPDVGTLSARFARQLHINPLPGIAFAAFNVTSPPFDDEHVRQAVSFAADRQAAVSVLGGPGAAQPTCQIIPPGLPGYRPYCPFTTDPGATGQWIGPDLARAKQLIAASRTSGMHVTVWAHDTDGRFGRYFVGLLRELGYRASLHLASDNQLAQNINDTRRHIQATVGNWIADYPSASDFFDLFFRCSSFRPADPAATRSSVFFCHPSIDRQMDQADRLQTSNPQAAASVWARIDREVTQLAPWVPLVSIRFADFTSARVGDYQNNPAWGALVDQFWVR